MMLPQPQVNRACPSTRRVPAPSVAVPAGCRCVRASARYKVVDETPVDLGSLLGAPAQTKAPAAGATEAATSIPTPPPAPAPIVADVVPAPPVPSPDPASTPAAIELPELPSVPSADELFNSLNAVSNSATDAITSAASEAEGAVSDLAYAVTGLGGALTGGVDALAGSVSGLGSNLTSGVGGVADTVSGSVGVVTEEAAEAVQAVTGAVNDAVGGALEKVSGALSGATRALDDALSTTSQTAAGAVSGVTSAVTSVTDTITAATGAAVSSASTYAQALNQSLEGVKSEVWGSIPPPAQEALIQVGNAAGAAINLTIEYPVPALVVGSAVVVPAAISSYSRRYGGFAGELPPAEVSALLSDETPALLLDIRPAGMREKDGIPELKLGARFKAAALPISVAQEQVALMDPRIVRQVGDRETLTLDIHAAFVANLKQIKTALAKVVVMDRDGSDQAREVARALRREGIFSAYIMEGGFKGWVDAELPTTTGRGIYYEATAADLISDNIEVVANKAVALASRLRDPEVAVPVATTTALGAVALYYYETTLQVIGIAGMSWSLYRELSQYDSPQEAFETWTSKLQALVTPKAKPVLVNGKPIPDDFVPPRLPAPPAAARADEVLAMAAKEAEEDKRRAEAARKAAVAAAAAQAVQAAQRRKAAESPSTAEAAAAPATSSSAAAAPAGPSKPAAEQAATPAQNPAASAAPAASQAVPSPPTPPTTGAKQEQVVS